jgi:hypothetical protein
VSSIGGVLGRERLEVRPVVGIMTERTELATECAAETPAHRAVFTG